MNNIDFIYNYNLNLVNSENVRISIDSKEKFNYSNYIKLIDMITKFNKLYLAFKNDYNKISKFNLSGMMYFVDFKEENGIKHMIFNINFKGKLTTLYINECNGIVESYILDNKVTNYIKLDYKTILEYFNLFKKYNVLIDMYKELKGKIVFESNNSTLISSLNGNLLYDLDTLDFLLISYGIIDTNSIELCYKLGNDPHLLGAGIKIDNEIIGNEKTLKNVSNHILKNLYIDKSKMINDYREKEKTLKI